MALRLVRPVADRVGRAACRRLRAKLRCWWDGHTDLIMVETKPRRILLRCLTCGRETSGWQVY